MRVAGVDISSLTTKAVIMEDDDLRHYKVIISSEKAETAAKEALTQALTDIHLGWADLDYIVTTGVGRKEISFSKERRSLVSCLAKGAHRLFPMTRTLIDVGAEHVNVINLDEKARVELFVDNDRCAAGAGVFLESLANLLKMPLEDMAMEALKAERAVNITSTCTIFAEQELISYSYAMPPVSINEILLGIHDALASRVVGLAKKVRILSEIVLCGGVARNPAFVKSLEKRIKMKLSIPEEPQIVAALGAAILAREALKAQAGSSHR